MQHLNEQHREIWGDSAEHLKNEQEHRAKKIDSWGNDAEGYWEFTVLPKQNCWPAGASARAARIEQILYAQTFQLFWFRREA